MLRLKLKTRQDLMFDQLKIEQPQYIAKQGTIQIQIKKKMLAKLVSNEKCSFLCVGMQILKYCQHKKIC